MAIARRTVGTAAVVSTAATTITLTYPTNAVGDIVFAFVAADAGTSMTGTGWTSLGYANTVLPRFAVLYRVVTTVLSGTTVLTNSNSTTMRGVLVVYSGATSAAPVLTISQNSTASTTHTTPAVAFTGSFIVSANAHPTGSTGANPAVSVGTWTGSLAYNANGLVVADGAISTTASTQPRVTNSASTTWAGVSIVMQAAAAGPVPVADAGVDATISLGATFSRTGTGTNTPTGYLWTIFSGPTGVGSTIGSAAALSWTPSITGTYTLRLTATNANGSGTDDVIVTVSATSGTAVVATEDWTGTTGNPWPATPNTWTHSQVNGTNGSNTIQGNAGRQTSPSTTTYNTYRSFLSSMPNVLDTDVTVKFVVPTQVECYPAIGISSDGVAWNNDGSYSQNAYQIVMQFTTSAATGKLELTRMKNSVQTALGAAITKTLTAGTQYQVRIQRQGTAVRVRLWPAASAEPGTWDFNVTETLANMPPAGKVGLNFQSGAVAANRTVDWDDLIVTDLNAVVAITGQMKIWNGSAWVAKPVKVWNGSAWVTKKAKYWNGSAWVVTPY